MFSPEIKTPEQRSGLWKYFNEKKGRPHKKREPALSAGFSAFIDGYVFLVARAQIVGPWADQTVVGQLLANMGGPARHAATGEDRSEEVRWDTQVVVGGSGIKIHVGQEALFLLDNTVDDAGHLEPFGLALHLAEGLGEAHQV